MTKWLFFLVSLSAILTGGNTPGSAEEVEAASNRKPPAVSETIDSWWISMMGEIRAVRTADGSKLKCSEVLEPGRPVSIRSFDIHRSAYVVDVARRAFGDATPLMRMPQGTSMRGVRVFEGKGEMILDTWECRFPPTKDIYIVVSLAVARLSDGRCEVCRFRPLLIANGRILARDEEMPEEMAKAVVGRDGGQKGQKGDSYQIQAR
jgi:hypothetical protein